ncbi:MAG: hypothetical protein J2P17_18495 [Mycobacterium sp.]|nr:hypothetical protein [Mycobacterium sp.]
MNGHPSPTETRAAVEDIFAARAAEAEAMDRAPARAWPARLIVHPHWGPSFFKAAESAGMSMALADAVAQVNAWLELIENA